MAQPTVKSLSGSLGIHLAPAGSEALPDTPITAVHISELLDPSPYLTGGELLLTTGITLPRSRMACRRYVTTLQRSGVSAVGIGLGPVHQEVPAQLASVCAELSFPLLVVPVATPFLTVTKAYWRALSRSSEQHLKDAIAAHRMLVDAAASPDPAASVLRLLARWLAGWAATLDQNGTLDQVHPAGFSDAAQVMQTEVKRLEVAGVHSVASFAAAGSVVVLYPLAVDARIVGYLAVGTREQLNPSQRTVVLTACGLLSLDAMRATGEESADAARRESVATLLEDGYSEAAMRLASRSGVPVMTREVRVLSLAARDVQDVGEAVRRWCKSALGVTESRTTQWFIIPFSHPPLDGLIEGALSVDPATRGVLSELVRTDHIGAVRARQAQSLTRVKPGAIVVPPVAGSFDEISGRLDRLGEAGPQLMQAAGAYLRARGQWEQASRDTGTHRNTLRYRIDRVRDLLDLDLDDPDVAARLWLLMRERGLQ
ncbi:PucR family transcriptional regulator, purine catabolism regulatory protein [Marmoricola sp. URHA0025 HA25]